MDRPYRASIVVSELLSSYVDSVTVCISDPDRANASGSSVLHKQSTLRVLDLEHALSQPDDDAKNSRLLDIRGCANIYFRLYPPAVCLLVVLDNPGCVSLICRPLGLIAEAASQMYPAWM